MNSIACRQSKQMRSRVFHQMLKTRGWKYRSFLRYLQMFKYISFEPSRGRFLESYYTLMRYIDDVVDGDVPLPEKYRSETEYVLEKIAFSEKLASPEDEVDELMLYCFELADLFGEDFHSETKDILESLLFDANRKGKWIIYPEKELMYHFHLLDIRGTIRATLKIFKDNPEKYKILEPLGIACRHQYDIEDIETDLAAGYVNITREECSRLGITRDDLVSGISDKIRPWIYFHAREGVELLNEHNKNLPQGNFSIFEKLVFHLVYEKPAREVFAKVLAVESDIKDLG